MQGTSWIQNEFPVDRQVGYLPQSILLRYISLINNTSSQMLSISFLHRFGRLSDDDKIMRIIHERLKYLEVGYFQNLRNIHFLE